MQIGYNVKNKGEMLFCFLALENPLRSNQMAVIGTANTVSKEPLKKLTYLD